MHSRFLWPTLGGTGITALATAATVLSLPKELQKIEVYFYDKNSSNTEPKRLRFTLSNDIPSSSSGYEVYDKQTESGNTQPKDDGENWKSIGKIKNPEDRNMWDQLFGIASHYVQVQHRLNVIASTIKLEGKGLDSLCRTGGEAGKCCCSGSNKGCGCTDGSCCQSCLCCYAKKTKQKGGECCCKSGGECDWTDLKKSQKIFNRLFNNLDSGWNNRYLQAVQVHIKLPDLSIETDLKSNSSENAASAEASSGAASTPAEPIVTPFYGTMIYSFVDYHSELQKPEGVVPKNGEYATVDEGKYLYFANVPQRFAFGRKPKPASGAGTPAAAAPASTSAKDKHTIDAIYKDMKNYTKVNAKIKEFANPSDAPSIQGCCAQDDLNGLIRCAAARNYMFMENSGNDDLKNIQDRIKGLKDCCGEKPAPAA